MKTRNLRMLMAAALAGAPLLAAAEQGQFLITPSAGWQYFDSKLDLDDEAVYGIGGEYHFTDNWAVELRYSQSKPDFKDGTGDVDVKQWSLDGLYYFGKYGMVQPYLALGVGNVDYDGDDIDDEQTQFNAGGGVRVNFTKHWSMRADLRALHDYDDSNTNAAFTLGLSYAFGGKPAPVAEPVAEPLPAAPLDSDGDGVTDDKDRCPNTPAGREVDEFGCEHVLKKTETIRMDIKFGFDSAEVPAEFMGEVEKVAQFLRRYANVKADIEGHTDSQGSDAYNPKLSQRRAQSVKDLLVERYGIDTTRLTAIGYGESQPIASNSTEEGRHANRRVVAVMKAETTQPAQ